MRKEILTAIYLGLWIVPAFSETSQAASESQDPSPDSDAIEAVARQEAPILHFHPDEGEHCCYPSDPDDACDRAKLGQTGKHKEPRSLDRSVPVFVQHTPQTPDQPERIKYWLWYNYNAYPSGPAFLAEHPADWEQVEILRIDGQVIGYFLSNHKGARFITPEKARLTDGRINVWVAKGSHAHYSTPTPSRRAEDPAERLHSILGFADEVADGGEVWDTRDAVRDISKARFFREDFRGDWGDGSGIFGPPRRSVLERRYPPE